MNGTEIEVNRRVLSQIRDPLIHLLRNAIDHGVGTPFEQRSDGKPARATLTLSVCQPEPGMIEISVADNGRGIDLDNVRACAVTQGLITEAHVASMSNVDAIDLIFQSGLTTSKAVTEISGRGLGLAIVKENVDNLGGKLLVETKPKQGTTFRMLLPVTTVPNRP